MILPPRPPEKRAFQVYATMPGDQMSWSPLSSCAAQSPAGCSRGMRREYAAAGAGSLSVGPASPQETGAGAVCGRRRVDWAESRVRRRARAKRSIPHALSAHSPAETVSPCGRPAPDSAAAGCLPCVAHTSAESGRTHRSWGLGRIWDSASRCRGPLRAAGRRGWLQEVAAGAPPLRPPDPPLPPERTVVFPVCGPSF